MCRPRFGATVPGCMIESWRTATVTATPALSLQMMMTLAYHLRHVGNQPLRMVVAEDAVIICCSRGALLSDTALCASVDRSQFDTYVLRPYAPRVCSDERILAMHISGATCFELLSSFMLCGSPWRFEEFHLLPYRLSLHRTAAMSMSSPAVTHSPINCESVKHVSGPIDSWLQAMTRMPATEALPHSTPRPWLASSSCLKREASTASALPRPPPTTPTPPPQAHIIPRARIIPRVQGRGI